MTETFKHGIEWIPPDLQQVVEYPHSKRVLHSGYALILDEKGSLVGGFEGSIRNVTIAVLFLLANSLSPKLKFLATVMSDS